MPRNDEFEKAIKFISRRIGPYTQPESLARWCELAKTEASCATTAGSLRFGITKRLDNVEDIQGYSLVAKVRLVFLFSRPVTDVFVKELKDNKCAVELNDERKITYFRSPGGDCFLQSEQDSHTNARKFKGKPIDAKQRMDSRDDECEKAIKFMSSKIKNYTKPENLEKWCELAKTKTGYDKCALSFSQAIQRRLDKIEGLKGYSLIEKVQLVFLFSRPVSPDFLKIMKEAKCILKLNASRRIAYFSSPDGIYVLQSHHNKFDKYFKGKPYVHEKKTAEIPVRIPDNVQTQPPPASPQSLPDPPEIDDVEIINGEEEEAQEQEKQENKAPSRKKEEDRDTSTKRKSCLNTDEDVDVTTENIQQEGPFNGQIDFDDFDNGNHPEFIVPNDDESPNHHKKRHPDLSQENPTRRKIDTPKEPEVVNPPEVNDVETRNEEEEAVGQKSGDSDDLGPIVNNNLNIQNQDARVGDQENNYDHLDYGEYPEILVLNDDEPSNRRKKRQSEPRQENSKRLKIERQEEPEIGNPPETNEVEMRKKEESDGLRPTRSNDLNIQDQDAQARAHDNNEAQNSGQNNQNRVKIEDFVEEIQRASEVLIPDEKPQLQPLVLETICLRKFAVQIEALAFNINLDENFQQKALKAVRLFKANNQLISIQDFNQLFKIVLKNLKSGRLENPTGSSIQLCRLFKHLERSLIRPLGEFLMADTLKLLETEIDKLEGNKDEIPMKAVQGKIDGLMLVLTNSWADLDE